MKTKRLVYLCWVKCEKWHRKIKKEKWKKKIRKIWQIINGRKKRRNEKTRNNTNFHAFTLNQIWIQHKVSTSLFFCFSSTLKNSVCRVERTERSDSGNYWPQVHFAYYIIFWNCIWNTQTDVRSLCRVHTNTHHHHQWNKEKYSRNHTMGLHSGAGYGTMFGSKM